MRPKKIISGGQTGADQGGLHGAKSIGIETGGTAPNGYRTETGKCPSLRIDYGMQEHKDWRYPPRTYQNARESDGTVWFGNEGSPGYWCTRKGVGTRHFIANPTPEQLRAWVEEHRIRVMNVAGNRESTNPGIFDRTRNTIIEAFK